MDMNLWFWVLGLTLLALLAAWWLRRGKGMSDQPSASAAAVHEAVKLPDSYSPKNVGNDASARPWEQQAADEAAESQPRAVAARGLPAGFDAEAFLESSKSHFVQLQAAWDRGDIPALRVMMTAEMLDQVQPQLAERERQSVAGGNQSEVVKLDAKLLGVEELADDYLASVEFSGLIRDEPAAGPNPFRELWSITRPRNGGESWLVAGVQAMQ